MQESHVTWGYTGYRVILPWGYMGYKNHMYRVGTRATGVTCTVGYMGYRSHMYHRGTQALHYCGGAPSA